VAIEFGRRAVMIEYRFVCVDGQGRWQGVRYVRLAGEAEATRFGSGLLRTYPAVLIYERDRRIAILAQIAGNPERRTA